ncbi:MAG: biotin synthase BioB [Elusimicrobia bacterium]|nr:biotin synthase BioB [Elusimicrobiota bacterium]MBD3411502.1 biotin synthase BioB [Elusimicrobiota bacterium]
MLFIDLVDCANRVVGGHEVSRAEAAGLCQYDTDLCDLMHEANRVREHAFGNTIKFCSIINARSGRCSEDCRFCAQSSHYGAQVAEFPLVSLDDMVSRGKQAYGQGARGFSIVTSGRSVETDEDFNRIAEAISRLGTNNRYTCASLGMISEEKARHLKEKGLTKFHHNLETSPSFFSSICSTHTIDEKKETISNAKKAGLQVCSGGIFGLGETWEQRIEMAFALKELGVDSIPINFINPIPGTPFETNPLLNPRDALRIIAVFRFIFPEKDIIVCGGREQTLRDLQALMYYAGANGTMLGNYLTTAGRKPEEDLQMAQDLGLEWQ